MHIFLLGATGNLGSHVLSSLLSYGPNHHIVILIRSLPKLQTLLSPSITSHKNLSIVLGDATNSADVGKTLREHNIDAIINVAGNQVFPWKEYELPKIALAVAEAAIEVGRERGQPLRAWFCGIIGLLPYPGTAFNLQDYLPHLAVVQYEGTLAGLQGISVEDLEWSLLCVGRMNHKDLKIEILETPRVSDLMVEAEQIPGWEDCWLRRIPFIGNSLNILLYGLWKNSTWYEDVADFLADDVFHESKRFVFKKVGINMKQKGKVN